MYVCECVYGFWNIHKKMIYHWVQWICLDDSNVKRFAEDEFRIDQRKMYAHNGLSPHNAHRTSNNKYVICSIWIIFVVSCLEYTRILNEILKFVCSKHHVRLPFFIASTFSSFISFSFYFYFSSNLSIYFYSIKCKSFSFLHDGCSPWIQHIKRSLWNSLHALSYFEMIDCRSSHLCKDTTNTEWKRNDIWQIVMSCEWHSQNIASIHLRKCIFESTPTHGTEEKLHWNWCAFEHE